MRQSFVILMVFVIAGVANEAQAQCGWFSGSYGGYSSASTCSPSYSSCYETCSPSRVYTPCSPIRTQQRSVVCDPVSPTQKGTRQYGGEYKAPAPKSPAFGESDRGTTTTPIPPNEEFKAPAPKVPVLYYDRAVIPKGSYKISTVKWIWIVDSTKNIQFQAPVINGYMPQMKTVTMKTDRIEFSYSRSLKYKDFSERIAQQGFITYGPVSLWKNENLVAAR
jgi:hypothetical protein